MLLHGVLRSLDFGLEGDVKLRMAPQIRHFKVGRVIQFPFQVALPSKWGRVLALASKGRPGGLADDKDTSAHTSNFLISLMMSLALA